MFDAILLATYGGPEKLEDVAPFLDAVLQGKKIPPARRALVEQRYRRYNGLSPAPQAARNLRDAIISCLSEQQSSTRVYLGNLYTSPTLVDASRTLLKDAPKNVLVFPCSPIGSAPSCQRYRQAAFRALHEASSELPSAPRIVFAPPFCDQEAFQRAFADAILSELAWCELDECGRNGFDVQKHLQTSPKRLILFTAHSIPQNLANCAQYSRQLICTARHIMTRILTAVSANGDAPETLRQTISTRYPQTLNQWLERFEDQALIDALQESLAQRALEMTLAYQSRSGSPRDVWIEPSVEDAVRLYKDANPLLKDVIVVPIGFFFENMETIHDLDVELKEVCEQLQLNYRRAQCVGAQEIMARFIAELSRLDVEDFSESSCLQEECRLQCRLDT
ncbi:MAG: ferrochelatase [Planctomycetia bacterium]|nr:ferrochelatase [Planctomycetia bacterium]